MINLDTIPLSCIHLPHAKDREETMYRELDYIRPSKDYTITKGISMKFGHEGISATFKQIVKRAQHMSYKQIMVVEDDIKFTSVDSKEYLEKAIDSLPDDWDILLGVSYGYEKLYNENEYLIKVGDFTSLICTVFNRSSYDKVLGHHPENTEYSNIDKYLGSLSKKRELNVYLIDPMIAMEYPGHSYNKKREVDYTSRLNNNFLK